MNNDINHLLKTLKNRFINNRNRHPSIKWEDVETRLMEKEESLNSLLQMENTGGEPDIVELHNSKNQFYFFDCSIESPIGRRSLCYDQRAFDDRKSNKPKTSAIELAKKMNVELLNEEQYRYLQTLGKFDTKTSSWIRTPIEIRKLGGALFCDRRYDTVFTYHNSAPSYYSSRGFRAFLQI